MAIDHDTLLRLIGKQQVLIDQLQTLVREYERNCSSKQAHPATSEPPPPAG